MHVKHCVHTCVTGVLLSACVVFAFLLKGRAQDQQQKSKPPTCVKEEPREEPREEVKVETPKTPAPTEFSVFQITVVVTTKNKEKYGFISEKFSKFCTLATNTDDSIKTAALMKVYGVYEDKEEVKKVLLKK